MQIEGENAGRKVCGEELEWFARSGYSAQLSFFGRCGGEPMGESGSGV